MKGRCPRGHAWTAENTRRQPDGRRRCNVCHPLKPNRAQRINGTPEERYWPKVDRRSDAQCWPWKPKLDRDGYGTFTVNGANIRAHRFSYELIHGPIEQGMQLDHLCRNRACVNPTHLEPVMQIVNLLRGNGVGAVNRRKTHCPRGHEYTPENTLHHTDRAGHIRRLCRACRAAPTT